MENKDGEIQEAKRVLREKLAKAKGRVFKLDDEGPSEKVEKIIQKPTPVIKKPEPIIQELTLLEKEIDVLTHKPVNLSQKYWVTPQKISQLGDLIETANESDFQPKEIIEALERGKILSVWLEWFEYFKILKVCTSESGKNICVVNLKKIWWKKWKTDLLIRLPIHNKWTLELYSSKTQELMGKFKILYIKLNEKTLLEKALWALWF